MTSRLVQITKLPSFRLLLIVLLFIAGLQLYDVVQRKEARAAGFQQQLEDVQSAVQRILALKKALGEMEAVVNDGSSVIDVAQSLAGQTGVAVTSIQNLRKEENEQRALIRIQQAPLAPFHNFVTSLETTHAGLIVRAITLRRSVNRPSRLDAEITVGYHVEQ